MRRTVRDAVENEINDHRRHSWRWQPLHDKCSDVCFELASELAQLSKRIAGLTASVMVGTWNGPVISAHGVRTKERESINDDASDVKAWNADASTLNYSTLDEDTQNPVYRHNWLRVRRGAAVLELDPTYIQFTGETWSYVTCIEAAQYYCVHGVEIDITSRRPDALS